MDRLQLELRLSYLLQLPELPPADRPQAPDGELHHLLLLHHRLPRAIHLLPRGPRLQTDRGWSHVSRVTPILTRHFAALALQIHPHSPGLQSDGRCQLVKQIK